MDITLNEHNAKFEGIDEVTELLKYEIKAETCALEDLEMEAARATKWQQRRMANRIAKRKAHVEELKRLLESNMKQRKRFEPREA